MAPTFPSPLARFNARYRKNPNGCWDWQGGLTEGYGQLLVDGVPVYAHRFAYQTFVGPIPERMQIDHLCRNKACVNPKHLEVVTQRENIRRGLLVGHHCPGCRCADRKVT